MISVVILSQDEYANIARCIRSVDWADDIVVVDSGSTDGTPGLAKQLGARVIFQPFESFAAQRNFALDRGQLAHEWVLHLDADETVSQELRQEIQTVVHNGSALTAFRVPFRLMLMGRWLRYSGMYPGYQVRFGRRDELRFRMVGHGQREVLLPAEVGTFRGDLIHDNFSKGVSEWTAKHARYAREEALWALDQRQEIWWSDLLRPGPRTERRRTLKALSHTIPMRPLARFIYVYVLRAGFLDGSAGFRYARLMSWYQWLIDLNIAEERHRREARSRAGAA